MTIPLLLLRNYGASDAVEVRYGEFVAGLQSTGVFAIGYMDETMALCESDAIALLPQHYIAAHTASFAPAVSRRIIVLSDEKMMRMVFPDAKYAAEIQWQHSIYALGAAPTQAGFWGRQKIAVLMDAVVAFAQGDKHCQFDATQSQCGVDIIAEYCQVIYGVEWCATGAIASANRTVAEQGYLTLVGIWESTQQLEREVESDGRPVGGYVLGVLEECATALQRLLADPPTSMPAYLVARMNRRYKKEYLFAQMIALRARQAQP
jgi:hypothetical protein